MYGAGDAVLKFEVHLGNGVFGEDGSIRDITCMTRANRLAKLSFCTLEPSRRVDLAYV